MLKALAVKELRETAGLAAIATIAFALVVAESIGVSLTDFLRRHDRTLPFILGDFLTLFVIVSLGLAVLVGLRQSVWESLTGTYPFLLHRPMSNRRIVAAKLAVGVSVCLVVSAVPVLAYALWAANPGNHASPFEWSMTATVWKFWLTLPTVYLSAFLCGIRPALWWGSRLLPLVATAVIVLPIQFAPFWPLVGFGAALLADVCLMACIFHVVETRDFS